jgi:acetylornithine deacetylase
VQDSNNTAELAGSAIGLLRSLVGFDSVSSHSNIPVIEFIEGYLKTYNIACTRIPSPHPQEHKCNLLARIGPEAAGGIVLSGHTDVVPVVGQPWDSDPFTLTARGDKLFGRGTSDMKAFIAVCLAMVPEFVKLPLARPLWLAFSYDEEVGCLGAPHLLEHMGKHIPSPGFAIIGEPTMMQVVTAHKGVFSFETVVEGLEWHSSQPHLGVNAVHMACDLVHHLTSLAAEQATSGMRDERFDPPHTTVHVGIIHGGTARNIIPRECRFNWEIRPLPGDNHEQIFSRYQQRCDQLLAQMVRVYDKASITTRPISRMAGVTLPQQAQGSCKLVMRCSQTNREHAVSFATEAGVFNDNGVPAIICGPGNIEQAHKPNEFIEVSQIHACIEFMLRLTSDEALYNK